MELNILHLYPDLMSLYGEYANLRVLCRHLAVMGVQAAVQAVEPEDAPDFGSADMIYMGAGTERGQKAALTALSGSAAALRAAAERGAVILFTGNAMETLGTSVTDAAGKVWHGLGLASYTTRETEKRVPVDVIAKPVLWDAAAVGFMNKCSVTAGITEPLFSELPLGFGNDAERGAEGYVSGNVFATHLTGPVLVKNPEFTDLIIRRLYALRGWQLPETLPTLPHEKEAYAVTLRELTARIQK
ncbi:MAG: hypothetical protein K2O18_19510 [Oscillospiraceae bacterium]|nr:hypothetical protein [Oscillospiraceae bacterium]